MSVLKELDVERYEHFLKMQNDLFWECNSDFEIVYVSRNGSFVDMDLVGESLPHLFGKMAGYSKDWDRLLECFKLPAVSTDLRVRFTGNHKRIPVDIQFHPLFDGDVFVGARGILRDVS